MSAGLPAMLLTSLVLHVLGLTAFAMLSGSLWTPVAAPHLLVTELLVPSVTAAPVPPVEPEPVAPSLPDTVEQPAVLPVPASLVPPEPPKVEPITPPKLVAKPMPERLTPRLKPVPPVPRAQPSEPRASRHPETSRAAGEREPGLPGSPLPAAGNVLGPAAERTLQVAPPPPIEGGEAGAGKLFDKGDLRVIPGGGAGGGSGGPGRAGLGTGGAGAGGTRVASLQPGAGGGSGDDTALARPLGGYQVKPHYPESARRQGVEGTTLLKVSVSDRGRVDDVLVQRSAGYHDLDVAAMEAVKQWRFEPAKQGNRPVAVWVMLPVRFTLK